MNAKRKKAEELIYQVFDAVDETGMNTAYYKGLFSKMSDAQFATFCKKPLCFRFHTKPWVVEPTLDQIKKGLDILNEPLMEKLALPYLYARNDGQSIWTTYEAIVVYIHFKKMKQFAVKKTNVTHAIDQRDMKTGLLTSHDKGGKTSDREMEGLVAMNMNDTMDELSTWRADYMDAKSIAYATISAKGTISKDDIPIDNEDSLAKNMMNYYMLGSCLYSNVINKDYYLPKTLKGKNGKSVTREVE
jgi:hypothetical protein